MELEKNSAELGTIIDKVDAEFMLADLQDGKSLSGASMIITTRELKRERFVTFRQEHGERDTIEAIMHLATH